MGGAAALQDVGDELLVRPPASDGGCAVVGGEAVGGAQVDRPGGGGGGVARPADVLVVVAVIRRDLRMALPVTGQARPLDILVDKLQRWHHLTITL